MHAGPSSALKRHVRSAHLSESCMLDVLWAGGEIWYHISFAPRSSRFKSARVHHLVVVAYTYTSNWWRLTSADKAEPVIPKFSTAVMQDPRFALPSGLKEAKSW